MEVDEEQPRAARVLCTDARGEFPVVVLVSNRDYDHLVLCRKNGTSQKFLGEGLKFRNKPV